MDKSATSDKTAASDKNIGSSKEKHLFPIQYSIIKNYTDSSKPIKDSSIIAYLNSIKKICKELFNSTQFNLLYFKDTESIIDYLDNLKSLATKKNTCTAILVLIKAYIHHEKGKMASLGKLGIDPNRYVNINEALKIYTDYHKKLAASQNDGYLDNVKTEKEEKNWITKEEIELKMQFLKNKLNKNYSKPADFKGSTIKYYDILQQILVLQLYTQIPPVRNDFANVTVINGRDTSSSSSSSLSSNSSSNSSSPVTPATVNCVGNYIDLNKSELVLKEYKTSKIYGEKVLDLPETLITFIKTTEKIKKELFKKDLDHANLLINVSNLSCMTKNGLTRYLNKIFAPKKISTTILRKVYISEKYPVIHSNRERLNDSNFMGHSIGMASTVYSKKN